MATRPERKPTENMSRIMALLHHGPASFDTIKAGMDDMHGAVLSGILARMVDRGLIAQDGETYRLSKHNDP